MRSDLRDNTETINKMIQFGTVKYGIVKQLKERSRSERDVTSDHEDDRASLPFTPSVLECSKTSSPEPPIPQEPVLNCTQNLEDHNHNNNRNEIINNCENIAIKPEPTDTYPEVELNHKSADSPILQEIIARSSPSPHHHDQNEDHPMSDVAEESDNEQASQNLPTNTDEQEEQCKGDDAITQEIQASNDRSSSPPPIPPQFPAAPMTLEAIHNMQIAIAQFAAKTLANGGAENEAAMKQLAFLQQTLFNLQQQQIFQLQLIQQLQSQLAMNQGKEGEDQEDNIDNENDHDLDNENEEDDEIDQEEEQSSAENLSNHHKSDDSNKEESEEMDVSINPEHMTQIIEDAPSEVDEEALRKENLRVMMENKPLPYLPKQDENTPLPYGLDLASSIITNHDHPPSLDEPNSLEMLQKRAQEVLDSASQGILAGNLADEFAFGKDKSGDGKNRNEPFFKHRCRYCGKVFGSDSALQIHIRSHTGERPFKCNVCGSRFTTKGNLKVHFQRHAQKFPHVPMNATPIPEHLDKFHPPLLEQMSPETSPQHQPQMPHPNVPVSLPIPFPPGAGFPGLPLYRPPLELLKSLGPYPNPFFGGLPPLPPPKRDQEFPTDLRKPVAASSPKIKDEVKEEPISLRIKEEQREGEPEIPTRPKSTTPPPPTLPPPPTSSSLSQQQQLITQHQHHHQQQQHLHQQQQQQQQHQLHQQQQHQQQQLQHNQQQHQHQSQQSPIAPPAPQPMPPQVPQLLPLMPQLPPTSTHLASTMSREEMSERLPLNYSKLSPERRSPIRSPASIPRSPFMGPMKHEMTLLPRPHSNDNSWENFIEVSNTSETVKLKELMKNKKLTDPNQCVVCDRVLSCKSALQMHYRTHTGERPFKCRICGRAFTTKGNLKTHMAVHKIRPPMRNFHQCPVCHKKYSNALVLQQHIRLHTGEPTDLTPEQIQAAEIRDFPPSMMPGSFLNPFAFNFGLGGQNGAIGSESSQGDNDEAMDCSDDFDDEDISDHLSNGGDSDRPKSLDEMKGMLFEQKLKIENNRPKSEASTSSAPTSPVSAINKSSPAPSDSSQGALDLTPRSAMPPLPPNPGLMPSRPPFGMFPNLPLFPPVSSTTQNMCSAMNSIAQSVMPSAPFNPLALSGVRGSTTCGICFKTFPCHSALEIHYRSHTKERPFKCTICDRGFTTKGNLKQHMLTHKIRDMEQDAFRNRAVKYMTNWKEGFE